MRTTFQNVCAVAIAVAAIAVGWNRTQAVSLPADELIVHEWGTFTSLQDEQGTDLAGVNTDDEPVPTFVHNLNPFVLDKTVLASPHWIYRQKGAPRLHPYVTMRLEPPVIYFSPPPSWHGPKSLDVSVHFRGGWLTEFYPAAKANTPGLSKFGIDFKRLTPDTTSGLAWNGLWIGTN